MWILKFIFTDCGGGPTFQPGPEKAVVGLIENYQINTTNQTHQANNFFKSSISNLFFMFSIFL